MVRGDVGAVKGSSRKQEAGSSIRLGELVATHVIPRPHTDVEKILQASDQQIEKYKKEFAHE